MSTIEAVAAPPIFSDQFQNGISTGWNHFLIPIDPTNDPDTLGIPSNQQGAHYVQHSHAINIVPDPEDTSNNVVQLVVQPGDAVTDGDVQVGKERSELERLGFGDEGRPGHEQWYAIRMRLVSPFPAHDGSNGGFTIVSQWHQINSLLTPQQQAMGYATPPISLNYGVAGTTSYLELSYGLGNNKEQMRRPIDLDAWLDVLVNVNWSTDSSGFVRAWVNNQEMSTPGGQTTLNGANAPNSAPLSFKIGMYRGKDRSGTSEVLYDQVGIFETDPRG